MNQVTDNKLAEVEQVIQEVLAEIPIDRRTTSVLWYHVRPLISRLLNAAHADALRAAELAVCAYCKQGVPFFVGRTDTHDNSENTSESSSEEYKYPACRGVRIRALTPERARLERELEVARAVRSEAEWWRHLAIMHEESYFAVEGDKRIADLEDKLAALEKGGAL